MPPIIPDKIPCESVQQLEQEFSTLQDALSLEETEETWDRIERALIRFSAVVKGGGYKYEKELVSRIKTSNKPIIHAMNSERTRLSAAALDCIVVIAPRLGLGFEALVPLFVPHILRLSTRTNKVYVTRSQAGVALIIGYCHIPSIMPHLLAACKDSKIVTGRAVAVEGMLRCLNKWDWTQKDIKAKVSDVEEVIKVTGRDKDAAIRQTSRKVFEAYKTLFPERIDEFIAPLTPVMRKYLDIKPGAKSGPPSKLKLSSSTSAVPSVPSTNARSNPGKHVRSVSSNAVATGSATLTGLKPHPSAPIPTHFMPPPAAIPSRGRSTSRTQVNSQTRPGSEHPLPEREDDQERRRVLSSASSNFSVKSAPANSYPTMEHRPPVRMTASQSHSREGKPPMSVTSGQARRVPRVVSVEPHPANRPDLLALAHKPPVRPMPPRAKTPISNRGPGREPTQSAPIGALGITFPSSEAGSAPILRKGAQRVPKPAPPPVPTKAEKSTTANNHSSNREAKPSIFRRGAPAPGETKNGEKEGEKPKEGYVPRRGGGVTQPTLSQLRGEY
ncbi:hypothetical protein K439DRAFT_1119805 [Ramaria rubella]|nr:hypothetical protein K439DRAFT_1119805 [Ramaria rubella]